MKESHDQSVQAWTPGHQDEIYEQSNDHSGHFEKGYQLYQLRSKLNAANYQIQKMTIEFQQQIWENRKKIDETLSLNEEFERKLQEKTQQLHKTSIMLEAEKEARRKINSNIKILQDTLEQIYSMMGLNNANKDTLLQKIASLKTSNSKNDSTINMLKTSLEKIKKQKQEEIARLKLKAETQLSKNTQNYLAKTRILESQIESLKMRKGYTQNLEALIRQLKMSSQQMDKDLLSSTYNLQSLQNQNYTQQEQIKSLRRKLDEMSHYKMKQCQNRVKYDEKISQLEYRLGIQEKKGKKWDDKYRQQKVRQSRLQGTIERYRLEIQKRQNQQIALQEECQSLKKQLHASQIYRQKYNKLQIKYQEVQERANNFANLADQYAATIEDLKKSLESFQTQTQQLEENNLILNRDIQEKLRQNSSISEIVNQQAEIIKQKNNQLDRLRQVLNQLNKKISDLQCLITKNKEGVAVQNLGNQFLYEFEKNISNHYQKLLLQEERARKTLQLEIIETKKSVSSLKLQLAAKTKEIAEERQERELAFIQNNRLVHSHAKHQASLEKKITEIRDTYRNISRVKSQKKFNSLAKLKIISCFNYCFINSRQTQQFYQNGQRCMRMLSSSREQYPQISLPKAIIKRINSQEYFQKKFDSSATRKLNEIERNKNVTQHDYFKF